MSWLEFVGWLFFWTLWCMFFVPAFCNLIAKYVTLGIYAGREMAFQERRKQETQGNGHYKS